MTITDRLADFAFRNVRDSAEDEYQEKILFQSLAVGRYTLPVTLLTVGAIFAWAIPGKLSALSLLVAVPMLVDVQITKSWLRDKAPGFKAIRSPLYYTLGLIAAVAMFAGIGYRVYAETGDFGPGFLVGAIIGIAAAFVFIPRKLLRQRAADKARIEASLED